MFGHQPGAPFEFHGPTFTEALSRLMYVVEQGAPFVLLAGETGCGRTTLLRTVETECRRNGISALTLNAAGLDRPAFLQQLSRGLCVVPGPEQTAAEAMAAIRDELTGRGFCSHATVILIDDLEAAADDLSAAIRFLTALNESTQGQVTVIAGCRHQPALPLQTLSALRVQLPPLTDEESVDFASAFLAEVQFDAEQLTADAEHYLVEFGEGSPARLARICEILCLAAAADPAVQFDRAALQRLSEETLLDARV